MEAGSVSSIIYFLVYYGQDGLLKLLLAMFSKLSPRWNDFTLVHLSSHNGGSKMYTLNVPFVVVFFIQKQIISPVIAGSYFNIAVTSNFLEQTIFFETKQEKNCMVHFNL